MTSIVHELVHAITVEHGHRALLSSDKINREEKQQAGKSGPRQQGRQRDRIDANAWSVRDIKGVLHEMNLGFRGLI
jgi:hypothetical protein